MKKITRTIETHTIHPAMVKMENGELKTQPLEPIVISNEAMTEAKALKLTQKTYGKQNQYVIMGIDTVGQLYAVDFDKFMEIAEPVVKPIAE